MTTLNYPSPDFIRTFDAALDKKTAFDIVVGNRRKRTAIGRTMKRIHAQPVDDRILVSLFDKLSLWDFYPGLARAIASGIYTIALYEGNEQLTITLRV